MKILLVHNYYKERGGEDVVFEGERDLLRQHGHDVEVLTFHNMNIQTIPQQIKVGFQSLFNFQAVGQLKRIISIFKPDVIHLHNFFPIASPSLFHTADYMGIPVVMTLHNYRLICAAATLFRDGKACSDCVQKVVPLNGIWNRCYRNSSLSSAVVTSITSLHKLLGTWHDPIDRYIVLTEFEKNRFLNSSLELKAEQFVIKPNFVFDPGEPNDYTKRDDYFVFVGRISPEKGIHTLIETFKDQPYRLKVIGTGPLAEYVKEAAKESKNIEYLGFQDKSTVIELLQNAKAMVFTSASPETFGMTIVEAFSAGTPVIASKLGGPSELVKHLQNGILVNPESVDALREAIKLLDTDPELCLSLSKTARKHYLESYAPDSNYEQLISIYHDMIREKSPKWKRRRSSVLL